MSDEETNEQMAGGYNITSHVGIDRKAMRAQGVVSVLAFQPQIISHPDDVREMAKALIDAADAAEADAVKVQVKLDAGELDEAIAEAEAAGPGPAQVEPLPVHETQPPTTRESDMKLSVALTEAGLIDLGARAAGGEWNDYFGPHAAPQMMLVAELVQKQREMPQHVEAIEALIDRVKQGDFDGTDADAQEWADSDEGREVASAFGLNEGFTSASQAAAGVE